MVIRAWESYHCYYCNSKYTLKSFFFPHGNLAFWIKFNCSYLNLDINNWVSFVNTDSLALLSAVVDWEYRRTLRVMEEDTQDWTSGHHSAPCTHTFTQLAQCTTCKTMCIYLVFKSITCLATVFHSQIHYSLHNSIFSKVYLGYGFVHFLFSASSYAIIINHNIKIQVMCLECSLIMLQISI